MFISFIPSLKFGGGRISRKHLKLSLATMALLMTAAAPLAAQPPQQAAPEQPQHGEVEQLRSEVRQLRDEIERLRSLVEKKGAAEIGADNKTQPTRNASPASATAIMLCSIHRRGSNRISSGHNK